MRLFVAINLPELQRERIYEGVATLREAGFPVRWTDPAAYHVTLKFLGDVRPATVARISHVLDRVTAETLSFRVNLGGVGAFPTIRRPQVIWLGVEPSPALRCLKQDIEWGLADPGFGRETRAFHPHVTLGRSQLTDSAGAFRGLDELAASLRVEGELQVASVELMRSHLSRTGPRYTPLHVSALKAPAGRR